MSEKNLYGDVVNLQVEPYVKALLLDAFSLNPELFRCDGESIDVGYRTPVKRFSGVEKLEEEKVPTPHPDIPHRKSWRHTTIDGYPDLRYTHNPVILTSFRTRLRLLGGYHPLFMVYSDSPITHTQLQSFQRFLLWKQHPRSDEQAEAYRVVFAELEENRQKDAEISRRLSELKLILDDAPRLSRALLEQPEIIAKLSAVQADLKRNEAARRSLNKETVRLSTELKAIVEDIRRTATEQSTVQLLNSYRPNS